MESGPSGDRCELDRARLPAMYLDLPLLPSADARHSEHNELERPNQRRCNDFGVCILHIVRKAGVHWTGSVGKELFLSLRLLERRGIGSSWCTLLADWQIKNSRRTDFQCFSMSRPSPLTILSLGLGLILSGRRRSMTLNMD